jgi:hydrogenase/urease accessory protein HupE
MGARGIKLTVFALMILGLWCALPATAHPIDPACLADASMSLEKCQDRHDGKSPMSVEAAMDRLKAMQGGFPGSTKPEAPSFMQTVTRFLGLGFVHILPRGLDHILFVLALFLGARSWRHLLAQVSAFTLAHSVTLGLAALNLISVPAKIVEPMIALSIAFLALENIFAKTVGGDAEPRLLSSRVLLVFAFGLFHGLGFAGVLSELGLDQNRFLTSLIAFNLGVEGGQLCVIALAAVPVFLLRRVLANNEVPQLYRQILVIPASVLIAIAGLWWAVERVFLGG